jgi:hypothetical protein
VEIPSHAAFSQPTSGVGFSVEAWMRPDALEFTGEGEEGYVHWLGKGEAGKMEWAFRFYPKTSSRPNRVSAYIFNSGPGLGSGAYVEDDIKAGKWMHIVAVFDPDDATIQRLASRSTKTASWPEAQPPRRALSTKPTTSCPWQAVRRCGSARGTRRASSRVPRRGGHLSPRPHRPRDRRQLPRWPGGVIPAQ